MKSLLVYIAFLLLIPLTGCYTVLLTTENTYEEELLRIESGDEYDDYSDDPTIIRCYGTNRHWRDYYGTPWWLTNPMVSKDIYPTNNGDVIDPRPRPTLPGKPGDVSQTDNGGDGTSSGNTQRDSDKKKVNADEGNQNNNNSSNRSDGNDKKNLRNDDGTRTTPKRR